MLVAQKGTQSTQRSRALGRGGQVEGVCTLGSLTLVQQSFKAGGELEKGTSIRTRADSYKGAMRSVLNRHKK